MKTKIYDKENNRTIIKDHDEMSLTIIGDYASSSITTYWVVNRFNSRCPKAVFLTSNSAHDFCDKQNKEYNTDTFIVICRTIFV